MPRHVLRAGKLELQVGKGLRGLFLEFLELVRREVQFQLKAERLPVGIDTGKVVREAAGGPGTVAEAMLGVVGELVGRGSAEADLRLESGGQGLQFF